MMAEWDTYLAEFVLAFLTTMGFALLFNVPPRALLACGLNGAVGRAVRLFTLEVLGFNLVAATYAAALSIATIGYLMARAYRMPRTSFTVTAIIPLIPGVPAFSSMIEMASGNIPAGLESGVLAALITGAIALGLTTVRAVTHRPGIRRYPPTYTLPGEEQPTAPS